MARIVGIGDYAISKDKEEKIVTYALSSCVALTAYCSSKKTAGMVHILLPYPSPKPQIDSGPYHYAATGIPLLLDEMYLCYGCPKSELKLRLFGGALSVREDDVFKLGQRNKEMAEKILSDMGLIYDASETGGVLSRSLEMDVSTGKVIITYHPINI